MKTIYKSILGVSVAAIVLAGTLAPVMVHAWGDSNNGRRSYTIAEIEGGKLGDKITFNSISNSSIGDEKNFVGAKVYGANVNVWDSDVINVQDGGIYTVRLYVHNNSPKGLDAVAENVKASFRIPTGVAKEMTIVGYLDSSNADPVRYWDEIIFKSDEEFYLEYEEDSAEYTNKKMGTVKLHDDANVTDPNKGALLGYEKLDGRIPGCYEYDGVLTINVKVHKTKSAPEAEVSKKVRLKDSSKKWYEGWEEYVVAKVGDEVEFRIDYKNTSSKETANDVIVRDVLPNNIKYSPNTTYVYNESHQNGVRILDNTVTTTGINIGNYAPQGNAVVIFTGEVVDNTMACGANQLVNWASITVDEKAFTDDASVIVKKDGESCKEKPQDDPDPKPTPTPTPTPTPEDTPTDTPAAIVPTGPVAVVTGAVGAGSMVTALGYFIASRKKLM